MEEAHPTEGRAFTPEEVLDELRDEVRHAASLPRPAPSRHCPPLPPRSNATFVLLLLTAPPCFLRPQVKEELEAARRESAIAEGEVLDLKSEIDRIQVRVATLVFLFPFC